MRQEILQDKIRGSIVGGACGDALGYTIEFVGAYREIVARYGDGGITEYDTRHTWLGDVSTADTALVSDDTQMTLYTAEGLFEAEKSGRDPIPAIAEAYLLWFAGQTGIEVNVAYDSELSRINELNRRRAPGNTCLSALMTVNSGSRPKNNSKGCGGIMRVAPIGLYGAAKGWTLQQIARTAGDVAELTHLHPLSTYSSAVMAVIVALCVAEKSVSGESFKVIVDKALAVVEEVYGSYSSSMINLKDCIAEAVRLSADPRPDWEIIENHLGGGWVAEETLAIALFSVMRHITDFGGCIVSAVNHGGDSDSTGAVAGNIIGSILGYEAIPEKFVERIQFKALMLAMADKFL